MVPAEHDPASGVDPDGTLGVLLESVLGDDHARRLVLAIRENIPVVDVGRIEKVLHGVDIPPEVGEVVGLDVRTDETAEFTDFEPVRRLRTKGKFNSGNCEVVWTVSGSAGERNYLKCLKVENCFEI